MYHLYIVVFASVDPCVMFVLMAITIYFMF